MDNQETPAAGLRIISPVFRDGTTIPPQYTCKGQNVNPPLNIFDVPAKSQSLALIMHDPDAPSGDYLHWLVWNIPPSTESISVDNLPIGAHQGLNGSGQASYMGPCPPAGGGDHHYIFDFYALDTTLDLPAGSAMPDVIRAMKGHVLDHAALIGIFGIEG